MEEYFSEILESVYDISDSSKEQFGIGYDKIIAAIQSGFGKTNINTEDFYIYPIGEYDYGTSIEELVPYKIIFEYSCKKSDLVKKLNYVKLRDKKRLSTKEKLIMQSMQGLTEYDKIFTNEELALTIQDFINAAEVGSTTIKQNSVFVRLNRGDKVYNYVIIIAYRFLPEKEGEDETSKIHFKYKYQNYELDYQKFQDNFEQKVENTDQYYMDTIVLFKYMEFMLLYEEKINYKTFTEFNLYENLFYNVPDALFANSLTDSIVNSINYLANADIDKFVTVDGQKLIKDKTEKKIYTKYVQYLTLTAQTFYKNLTEALNQEDEDENKNQTQSEEKTEENAKKDEKTDKKDE